MDGWQWAGTVAIVAASVACLAGLVQVWRHRHEQQNRRGLGDG